MDRAIWYSTFTAATVMVLYFFLLDRSPGLQEAPRHANSRAAVTSLRKTRLGSDRSPELCSLCTGSMQVKLRTSQQDGKHLHKNQAGQYTGGCGCRVLRTVLCFEGRATLDSQGQQIAS
jgi:hypothetical protein